MREIPNALEILQDERIKGRLSVPASLVDAIYRIEERVQFDDERHESPQKIKKAIKAVLDEESLKEANNGNVL